MSNTDKLRGFADKWGFSQDKTEEGFLIDNDRTKQCLSDLTALISEGYVEKHKYDELLRQRDELRERCKQLEFMIEKGLGWDDVKNDISMPHEL